MNFLQPAYLWALSALAVPLAIHLLSRKEGKVLRMGSLRHVRETPTRQFKSIRLNEYLLLILRMIILGLLAFLMAGWYLENLKDHSKWLVMEPGLEFHSDLAEYCDSLYDAGFERRILIGGFPKEYKYPQNEIPANDYAARLEELAKLPVDEIIVLATNRHVWFKGPLVSLPENVKWIVVDGSADEREIDRVLLSGGNIFSRTGSFDPGVTKYSTLRMDGKKGRPRDTVNVVLVFDPEFDADKTILNAVLTAVRNEAADVIEVSIVKAGTKVNPSADWLIWLSKTPPPVTAANLVYVEESVGPAILERAGPNAYRLTQRLNSEVATSRNLAVHLMNLLLQNRGISMTAESLDRRVLPLEAAFRAGEAIKTTSVVQGNRRSTEYLLALLFLFLVLERFIAYRNKQ